VNRRGGRRVQERGIVTRADRDPSTKGSRWQKCGRWRETKTKIGKRKEAAVGETRTHPGPVTSKGATVRRRSRGRGERRRRKKVTQARFKRTFVEWGDSKRSVGKKRKGEVEKFLKVN